LLVDYCGDPEGALARICDAVLKVENRAFGGNVNFDSTYYLHFGISDNESQEGYSMELDVLAFDTEETYSVLSQYQFYAEGQGIPARFNLPDRRALRDRLLATCAEAFSANRVVVQLRSGTVACDHFFLQNAEKTSRVQVTTRIATLGDGPLGVLTYNAGAVFEQICVAKGIPLATASDPQDPL
jgi:hypothetical protein